MTSDYLEDYKLRNRSGTFAEHALKHVTRLLGALLIVDISEQTILGYQSARLKEKAAPKTINEEVGFLLRVLPDHEAHCARLRRKKQLKLKVRQQVGRAFSADEKALLYEQALKRRSAAIYPALILALNYGLRDKELRDLQWGRIHLDEAYLVVWEMKTEGGTGRTIPLNSVALKALMGHVKWYEAKFGQLNAAWFVFPFGKPQPTDPTKACTTFKTVWTDSRGRLRKGPMARQSAHTDHRTG